MNFSYDQSWDTFEEIFLAQAGIRDSWNKLIDFHESIHPAAYWDALRHLDVVAEQTDIRDWMVEILENFPLPKSVVALWIGITQLVDEETGKEYYAIYLTGSKTYDEEDIDWAANPVYQPEENYGIVQVLTRMNEIISEDSQNYNFLDWIFPLAYCAFTIDEIIRNGMLDKSLFTKVRLPLQVSVGFEEGDFVNLSPIVIKNSGL